MQNLYPIIPKPAYLRPLAGYFVLKPETTILNNLPDPWHSKYLTDILSTATGFELPIHPGINGAKNTIQLQLNPSLEDTGMEGYILDINQDRVKITANHAKGIFYGIQTVRQLLPLEIEKKEITPGIQWNIPCCQITDKPRFEWRGFMLDEGRHFHGLENIYQTIDLLALQKLNILHWHLTEDQGWRIEIKQYPKLIQIGSSRAGTIRNWWDMWKGHHDGVRHQGYYTQDMIRKVVGYASTRNITIIPEIEIPGHAMAALAAYPQYSCLGGPFEVPTRFGIFKDIFCPGKDETFEFLQNILDEIINLFPSPIIHIGGDEAPRARWENCEDCQRRILDEGLKGEAALQVYFTNRIMRYLESQGRLAMGWNEIVHQDLNRSAIIQFWIRHKKGLFEAIHHGNRVVNSAYLDTYLDHSYQLTPLERAYTFEPCFKDLDGKFSDRVLGIEAPLWTEWVPNKSRLEYQTYPRLTAFAETGWTPREEKDYLDFLGRLKHFYRRLDLFGIQYAPEQDWDPPWYKRIFSIFTIAQPQNRTRNKFIL